MTCCHAVLVELIDAHHHRPDLGDYRRFDDWRAARDAADRRRAAAWQAAIDLTGHEPRPPVADNQLSLLETAP